MHLLQDQLEEKNKCMQQYEVKPLLDSTLPVCLHLGNDWVQCPGAKSMIVFCYLFWGCFWSNWFVPVPSSPSEFLLFSLFICSLWSDYFCVTKETCLNVSGILFEFFVLCVFCFVFLYIWEYRCWLFNLLYHLLHTTVIPLNRAVFFISSS